MSSRWRSPWAIAAAAGLAIVAAAFAPAAWQALFAPPPGAGGGEAAAGLPWQVEPLPGGGVSVFGLSIGAGTLADAERLGDLRLAVVAAPGEAGALEGYVEQFRAGFVGGRLVLSAVADADALARWRERAGKREPGAPGGSALRHVLSEADRAEALRSPIGALTFIPAAQLDAATLRARFGEPAERLADGERLEHWLYPALGLAVTLDADGREVLQYVAPAQFEARLRAPLRAAGARAVPAR